MTAPTRVFISYAREDHEAIARLVRALRDANYQVWWDDDIGGGSSFSATINQHLKDADAVLVAWSARSAQSRWVLAEAESAANRGVLIPLLFDATPLALGLSGIQAIDFTNWGADYESDAWRRLLVAVEHVASAAAPRHQRPPIHIGRHAVMLIGLIGLGAGVMVWITYGRRPMGSVLGHPLLDALCVGYATTSVIVLWSAIEVRGMGFDSRVLILKRIRRWLFVGAAVALVLLVAAVAGGAAHGGTSRALILELIGMFGLLTLVATASITSLRLLQWMVRRWLLR